MFKETIIPIIVATINSAIRGKIFNILLIFFFKIFLKIIPSMIGKITIQNVLLMRPCTSTST